MRGSQFSRVAEVPSAVSIRVINPLLDHRWDDLVARHPRASVFHQRGWLQALARTYNYEPLVVTNAAEGESLGDGLVLCRVSSWITGTRLVSLPFSDHCDPLLNDSSDSAELMNWLRDEGSRQHLKYIELRPLLPFQLPYDGLRPAGSFCFHELDIRPSLEQIFRGLHKDSIQRRIRRAEKENLAYEAGCTRKLADEFYRLLMMTRRRHELLPQPRSWFANLIEGMGDRIQIRVARKNETPIAAMLTLRHGGSVVYKYGCSDESFHNLGGMPFLFWKLIEESRASGAATIDFGRSDVNNKGLITFKDRFGTTRKSLTYYRYSDSGKAEPTMTWNPQVIRWCLSILPDTLSSTAGRILYRHMG